MTFATPDCKSTKNVLLGQNNGSHLAPCSVSDGGIKELTSEVITCNPFPHTFCNILFITTYQQSCNSPPHSSSTLRRMPPAVSSTSSNLSIRSPIFCILTPNHWAHLIHGFSAGISSTAPWACQLWTTRFTPLPLSSLLNFSVGLWESLDHSGFSELQHKVYLGFQHSACIYHQVASGLLFLTAILTWK